MYLSCTDKDSRFEALAKAVGASPIIEGDTVFRAMGRINRLIFQNVGVKKHGRRNLSYASYTGAEVVSALGLAEKSGSVKALLSGMGWEGGKQITIGCSVKGRVWYVRPEAFRASTTGARASVTSFETVALRRPSSSTTFCCRR